MYQSRYQGAADFGAKMEKRSVWDRGLVFFGPRWSPDGLPANLFSCSRGIPGKSSGQQ